jgi:hypothetical protein
MMSKTDHCVLDLLWRNHSASPHLDGNDEDGRDHDPGRHEK